MDITKLHLALIVTICVVIQKSISAEQPNETKFGQSTSLPELEDYNPLSSLILNQEHANTNHSHDTSSRVKRQYIYNPYYGRRYYPYPPIFAGFGGIGILPFGGGFGGRGFGGRGFGGRGFGGRGFGGRGIGGRGIGGRGIGGIGRGGIGGGRGGRG